MFWNKNKKTKEKQTNYNKKVIIIGGGLSGLISGIHCLLKGMNVTIIEKNNQFGGKLSIPKHENYPYIIYNKTKFKELLDELNIKINIDNDYKIDNLNYDYNEFIDFLNENSIDDDKIITDFSTELLHLINNKKANKKYEKISIKDYVMDINSKVIKKKILSLLPNDLSMSVLLKYLSLYFKGEFCLYEKQILNAIKEKYFELGGKYLLNKEVRKINFYKKNIIQNVILDDNITIEGDYFICAIDPYYTLNNLLNNKFNHIISIVYKDYLNIKMNYKISFLFAINKPFEYNNISVFVDELKVNSSKVDYITFKKSLDDKYIYCDVYQKYDDYEYLKIFINKGNLFQEAYKKTIKEIINVFNNNFEGYKITYKDSITSLDIQKHYNSFNGTFSGFYETPNNYKVIGECNIKNLKNLFLCSPNLLYEGGIVNSIIIGKQCVKKIEEEIKNEEEKEI